MFAIIDTNGANTIAIHIPLEGSEKTLPMLARMLESNATFLNKGYSSIVTCAPKMSIALGNKVTFENSDFEMDIQHSDEVIGEGFVVACPDTYISMAKGLKTRDETNRRLSTENEHLKNELARIQRQLEDLAQVREAAGVE